MLSTVFLMSLVADSVVVQGMATFGTIIVAIIGLIAQRKWRHQRRRAGKSAQSWWKRLALAVAIVCGLVLCAIVIWLPDPTQRLTWLAYIGILEGGALPIAVLYAGIRVSELTAETRKERLSLDMASRANENLLDYVTRISESRAPSIPLPFTDYDSDEATQDCA